MAEANDTQKPSSEAVDPGSAGSPSLGEKLRMKVAKHAIRKRQEDLKRMYAAMEEAADEGKLSVKSDIILSEDAERKLWGQGVLTSDEYDGNKRSGTKLYWGGDLYDKNMESRRKYYQKIDAKAKRAASRANDEMTSTPPKGCTP